MCWKKSCSVGHAACTFYLKNHNVSLRSLCLWPKIHYLLLSYALSLFFPFIFYIIHLSSLFFHIVLFIIFGCSLSFSDVTVQNLQLFELIFYACYFQSLSSSLFLFPRACSWQISLKLFKFLQQVRVPLVTHLQFFQFITKPDARHQRSVILSVGYDE
jgi:hypothetical protein